ncbi:hypothetical protein AYR62_12820 [Secundilactobacillus paracollinoides]|uniref:NAD(P)H-dependent oxidoreductase n=1 Tax=Secundilactobacillus paracollinoides TaxID=240427 RepID=UPI00081A51A4|nr:NAD(P)H-dependent oxidoreductase [Secundilactobacillus paracollinoides]ANZ64871.1 hypothetical protein AYR62_12820 [Secundilactobacillus paracollinoides]
MKTIIYAHPWEKSFNHAILTTLTQKFQQNGDAYQVIDLYEDHFDPVYSQAELKAFSKGDTPYQLVKDYQQQLQNTDDLYLIAPIWWSNLPGIVKGFFDKVMLKGFAYSSENEDWHGLMTWLDHVTVITTSEVSQQALEQDYGDPIRQSLINTVFRDLGISSQKISWHHLGNINTITPEDRQQFLKNIALQN